MSTIGRAEEQQNLSVSCAFEYEQMIEELFSGFHQGQRPAMPRKQAGHMTAPASTVHSVNLLLQTGGRPHMTQMDVRPPQAINPAYRGAEAFQECLRRIPARSASSAERRSRI